MFSSSRRSAVMWLPKEQRRSDSRIDSRITWTLRNAEAAA